MKMRRFGQTMKMPSTLAIKHQIVRSRYEEERKKLALPRSEDAKDSTDEVHS